MADFMSIVKYDILKGFPDYTYLYFDYAAGVLNRAEKTILSYAKDIRSFYDFLITKSPLVKTYKDVTIEFLDAQTFDDIQEYMSYLRSGTRYDGVQISEDASARSRKLSALRSFLQYYHQKGQLKINVARLIDNPKIKHDKKDPLTDKQVKEMFKNVQDPSVSDKQKSYLLRSQKRDLAIVTLLAYSGIRVSELVNIDIDDIDFSNHTIDVTRKGGFKDTIYINDEALNAINDYIENERRDIDGEFALFLSSRTTNPGRISVSAVERMIKKFGNGITNKAITPHTFRYTFGTSLREVTGDLQLTADTLGHKNVSTTAKYYTRTSQRNKIQARNAVKYDN